MYVKCPPTFQPAKHETCTIRCRSTEVLFIGNISEKCSGTFQESSLGSRNLAALVDHTSETLGSHTMQSPWISLAFAIMIPTEELLKCDSQELLNCLWCDFQERLHSAPHQELLNCDFLEPLRGDSQRTFA